MPLSGEYVPSPQHRAAEQVALYESSGGKRGGTMIGKPVVIVTMRGAESGKIRKVPVMRVEHDGSYALVASMGGAPNNPAWVGNLRSHPEIELQDGAIRQDMVVREASGDERAAWWRRAVEAFPNYAGYQTKTERQIPVFIAESA
jgi:deazaflavin-dependent oxidoreductase (nitroreductase family)